MGKLKISSVNEVCPHIDENVNLARFSRTDKNVHVAHSSYGKIWLQIIIKKT